jgi:hypothetical protein
MIDAGYDGLTNGLRRVNALLSWWGLSDAGDDRAIEAQIARLERFTAHLQHACREIHARQLATALSTKNSLACLVQDLARCQRPNDVMAVESALVAALRDAAVTQAKMWTELACQIQASRCPMTRPANARFEGKRRNPRVRPRPPQPNPEGEQRLADGADARPMTGPSAIDALPVVGSDAGAIESDAGRHEPSTCRSPS